MTSSRTVSAGYDYLGHFHRRIAQSAFALSCFCVVMAWTINERLKPHRVMLLSTRNPTPISAWQAMDGLHKALSCWHAALPFTKMSQEKKYYRNGPSTASHMGRSSTPFCGASPLPFAALALYGAELTAAGRPVAPGKRAAPRFVCVPGGRIARITHTCTSHSGACLGWTDEKARQELRCMRYLHLPPLLSLMSLLPDGLMLGHKHCLCSSQKIGREL